MTPLVLDASALGEYLLGTERGRGLVSRIQAPDASLHVPALCDVEVIAVLRRAMQRRWLTLARAQEALTDYLDLPLIRHRHESLLGRALALHHNFSAYDATYVALAERLDATLLTADSGLAAAIRKRRLSIEVPTL